MAAYPPPPPRQPFGQPINPAANPDWRFQRRILREQQRMQREIIRAEIRAARRSSLVGPLLVITLGVVVLLAQIGRLSWPRLLTFFAHWWPLLLVLVGAVRLVEWVLDRSSQERAAPGGPRIGSRSLGGGVVTLLVLLTVGGLVASAVVHHGSRAFHGEDAFLSQDDLDEFLGDKHESDQTLAQAVPPGTGVTVDTARGDLTITGDSTDGQVHLDLHKEVFTRSDRDATRKAAELVPQMHLEGDRLTISLPSVDGARAYLKLSVPAASPLNATANHGDVHVSQLAAPLLLTANHGDMDVTSIAGPVKLHLNNGDSSLTVRSVAGPVELAGHAKDLTFTAIAGPVSMSGEFFGMTHLEKIAGEIQFHTSRTDLQLARLDGELEISSSADLSADQAIGPMVLNTRNRNITLERIAGDISVVNRNGTVDLISAPPLGNVSVENRNGSVNVTLPTGSSFTVQADTTNGSLENEFSLPSGGGDNHPSMTGSVGRGGPLIRLSTSQGDIALKHSEIAPLPPAAPLPPLPPHLTRVPQSALDAARQAQITARNAVREAQKSLREAQPQNRKTPPKSNPGEDDN